MVDSTHNHHRQQSSNDHPLAVIPCQRQFNATAVVHGSPLIKSWLRHPFDWVNDARTHAIVQQEEQDQKQLQHVQNDTQSPENTMAGQSPDQCSSISSSSRFSITSTISSASTTTSTCVTFNNDPCCITTASDVDTATTVVSATEEGKHLQKADVVLHRHHTGNSLRLLSVWLVTHLLLQTALCIALTSAWQQETHVTTATTVHEPQQRLHYAKQSKPKHHRQQQQQQQKSRRLAAITDNRGSTALASFAASSGLTVAIPKCWPPLTGSKIISDTVQAMGPPMATLWAEHERSMALYKERFSVRPTERRDHMRKQRRYHYHRHRDNDNDSSSSSSGELEYTRPESQAVMDLARETLEYFEQWYGDHSEQQRAVDDSAEMKTIHWLRQVTVT
ncbi:hypothetical protein BDB00DRAFT_816494 [Zychaea mexicana]|uniref:uncharacterized protein n=1 Tax=Zychaea mexicana TaxID=64656 RepID=UPI0022FF3EC9|nr:uncharacterized protein BDB00DRAFT_816494 [Zychaea mexicana]KAI9494972.1 hypothetical protein BDB00DRAFT_816494 [Zychaea mexicana]